MSSYTGVVTRKGQITIPAEMRQDLGIKVGDVIEFQRVGDRIRLSKRQQSIAERTKGMFRDAVPDPPYSREQEREAFAAAMAEGAAKTVVR